jgi:hypothetical protein
MPWIGIAPVFFVFLGDARRLQRIGELRGKPVRNGTLEGFFNASIDAALAMQTMILCAESSWLGVCPISVIRNEIDKVAAILGCPIWCFRSPGFASVIRRRRLCQPAPAARATTHSDSYDDSGCRRRSTTTTAARCAARHPGISSGPTMNSARPILRLVRRQGAPGREGRRRGVPALSAFPRIYVRLKRNAPAPTRFANHDLSNERRLHDDRF